jgi:hypothetical protein
MVRVEDIVHSLPFGIGSDSLESVRIFFVSFKALKI